MLDALAFASEGLYSDKVSVTVVTNMATVAVLSGRAEQIYRAAKKHSSIVPLVDSTNSFHQRLSVKYGIRTSDASDGLADG